uniref:Ig-like domain-containing protein n=1 Tax=Terrapene triunguis TaxID=2587831 RepID=A0A674K0C2_9SAUR
RGNALSPHQGMGGGGTGMRAGPHSVSGPFPPFPDPPVQPKVKVSPTKSGSGPHSHLLVCSVMGVYPGGIEIKWLKNGQEQTAGAVFTELLQNGDWTFQILVMLEMSPQRGDVYTCQVEHISLREGRTHLRLLH